MQLTASLRKQRRSPNETIHKRESQKDILMDGYWVCSGCQAPTTKPTTHLFCPDCDKIVKSLEKKVKAAVAGLKRIKKIAYPRPEATDMIDKLLKIL
jgi:uncharacterized Zn finger protein (UPF0148 family)